MRFTFVILLFLSFGANAQMIIKAHPNYVPLGRIPVTPLLDIYTNATHAYSLRKLRTAYTGSAIRVRRDSTGQAEQDIGFTSFGDLDTVALKNFVRNNNAFVVTWYDQQGSVNVTNATQAAQPRIMLSGVIERINGFPTINTLSGRSLIGTVNIALSNMSYFGVVNVESTVGEDAIISLQVAGSSNQYRSIAARSGPLIALLSRTAAGNFAASSSIISLNTSYVFSGFWRSNTDREIFINGGNSGTSTNTSAGFTATKLLIFKLRDTDAGTLNTFRGKCSELVFFNSDQSSNKTGIESNINSYYAIY
jgi:hypothetical protein